MLLVGGYAALAIVGAACFVAAFVLFGGWQVLDSLPSSLQWTAWVLVGLLVVLVAASWAHRLLWPERFREMEAENARRRRRTK
jgi:fatty acid desaturase